MNVDWIAPPNNLNTAMTRLFTITFSFEGHTLQAMVSVSDNMVEDIYNLKFKPDYLNSFLPNGYLHYSGINGYKLTEEYKVPVMNGLIENAGKAIKEKMIREFNYKYAHKVNSDDYYI